MKQIIRTFHNYSDKEVNDDIAHMIEQEWYVRQFEYSTQNVNGQVRACIILLYESDDASINDSYEGSDSSHN